MVNRRYGNAIVALTWLCLAATAGCAGEEQYFHRLHGPSDAVILPPGGPFEVPVAYVSNFRTGQIAKLDLKRFDLLVEESASAWMAAPYLACGRDRVLEQIAVASDGETWVDVYVSDSQRDQILRVPHVIADGQGGFTFATASAPYPSEPLPRTPDGNLVAEGPFLDQLEVRDGYATTEEWTVTYRGQSWEVAGSRSGRQLREAVPGIPYESDAGEIAFTVLHLGTQPVEGTSFAFFVDTGIVEFELPGIVADMLVTPAGTMLVASIIGYGGENGLWILHGEDALWLPLPADTVPENLAVSRDGDALFVADSSANNRVLKATFAEDDPESFVLTEIPVSESNIDVAHGRDPDHDHLFVASAYGHTIEIIDLTTGDPVDVNPWTPEVEQVDVGSMIIGLDASAGLLEMNSVTASDRLEEKYAVVATTFAGYLHVIEADTGCLAVESSYGPYLEQLSTGATVSYNDVGPASDTRLLEDMVTGEPVSVNACGGIARDQAWTLRYSELTLDWELEGAESGVQENRVIEDVRYVSDDGEVSFVLASGARASSDGDWIQFWVNDGVSPIGVQELPTDPVVYTDIYDLREGSWWEHKQREIAIVANSGDDVVLWIHMEGYGTGGIKYFR